MATNKKKDAASLFELIDKSTLKVPKSGALKIPSWYSSKTNPPTQPTSGGVHVSGAANGSAPTVREIKPVAKPDPKPEPKLELEAEVESTPVEPMQTVATPAPQLTPKTIAPFGSTHVEKPAMRPIPPAKGVFAPVVPGASHSKNKVIILSAACGVVALVLLIFIIGRLDKGPKPPVQPGGGQATTNQQVAPPGVDGGTNLGGTSVVGGGGIDINTQNPNLGNGNLGGNPINGGSKVGTTVPNNGGGQVVTPAKGSVQESTAIDWNREPEGLNYIIIASYASQRDELARKAADFLANNGVDVVILRVKKSDSILLIMRQGFTLAARAEAEAAMARIRKVGELHPDFKKTNVSVFATPYRAKLNFTGK